MRKAIWIISLPFVACLATARAAHATNSGSPAHGHAGTPAHRLTGSPSRQTGTQVGQVLPAFTAKLLDAASDPPGTRDFDSNRQDRITAYVVVGTRCPATRAYAERLTALEKTYGPKRVDFVYVYPNREDTAEAQLEFHRQKELHGRLINDRGGAVAVLLGAQKTSEVVLTDAQRMVVYRGAIDDSRDAAAVTERYLQTAIDQTLAGKPVSVTTAPVRA